MLSSAVQRKSRDPRWIASRQAYLDFRKRHELLVEFVGGGEEYSGNDLRVYRIDKKAAAARLPE